MENKPALVVQPVNPGGNKSPLDSPTWAAHQDITWNDIANVPWTEIGN